MFQLSSFMNLFLFLFKTYVCLISFSETVDQCISTNPLNVEPAPTLNNSSIHDVSEEAAEPLSNNENDSNESML